MSIFYKIDKILASFGNMKAMRRTHVDTFTEDKINSINIEKYGVSEYGILYADYQELAGYFFINTIVLSCTDFKTNKGTILTFNSKSEKIELNSDNHMVESDYSNVSDRYITKISYPISEEEMLKVQNRKYDSVDFKSKKHIINFVVKSS